MARYRRGSASSVESFDGQHCFEHWYRDNCVYFITARCRDQYAAFESERAKAVFWDRFGCYTSRLGFFPWVTSLLSNHYHTLGYLRVGENLGPLMQKLHGSVAKLVNDLLPERRQKFWVDAGHQNYFDGCIRDEKQCRFAYAYTLTQSVRHGICADWRDYPHTKVQVELERGLKRALKLGALPICVPYKRYEKRK